jgi:RecA-family ATPase
MNSVDLESLVDQIDSSATRPIELKCIPVGIRSRASASVKVYWLRHKPETYLRWNKQNHIPKNKPAKTHPSKNDIPCHL